MGASAALDAVRAAARMRKSGTKHHLISSLVCMCMCMCMFMYHAHVMFMIM